MNRIKSFKELNPVLLEQIKLEAQRHAMSDLAIKRWKKKNKKQRQIIMAKVRQGLFNKHKQNEKNKKD